MGPGHAPCFVSPGSLLGIALALISTLGPRAAGAQPRPSEAPVPSCLDQSIVDELGATLRPRGVQKRVFTKDGQVSVTARGGIFAADLLSSSYSYGGALAIFFTEDLGLEVSLDVSPMRLDLDSPLAEFFGDDRFEAGTGFLALGGLLWSPIHAKLKIGDSIIHSDFMLAAGGGRLFGHEAVQGIAFDAGAILDFYTTSWLTVRLDFRDVVMVQEAVAETRLTNNIIATAGLSFWIPTGIL